MKPLYEAIDDWRRPFDLTSSKLSTSFIKTGLSSVEHNEKLKKIVSNSYSNIYLHWFSYENKNYLRVLTAHHRKEFLEVFEKAYNICKDNITKDENIDTENVEALDVIEIKPDIQTFIMAGDLLSIILIDIDKYFSLFAPQKEIAKGIWEINHPLTSKENLLPFIEKRIEKYMNEYNDLLTWKEHIVNMKKDNIHKDTILTYNDNIISFEQCDIDNNGKYFITGGSIIQFLEIIYIIAFNINSSTIDKIESNNENPLIIDNDRILCSTSKLQFTEPIIRYVFEKFGFLKNAGTTYDEVINDMKTHLKDFFDIDTICTTDLQTPFNSTINYAYITDLQDNSTFSKTDDTKDIICYSDYNPNNPIDTDLIKMRILKDFGYTVQLSNNTMFNYLTENKDNQLTFYESVQIFKKTLMITVPIMMDVYSTYIKLLEVLKCDLTDFKEVCTLEEVLTTFKNLENSNNAQVLLLNKLTNTIAFTHIGYHSILTEYIFLAEIKGVSEKTLILLKDLYHVLQNTSKNGENTDNICIVLQSIIDNIKTVTSINNDHAFSSLNNDSCDFCKVGLVKQKSLIQHFVHRHRENNSKWQDIWSPSAGLCANILKYLENVKTFRSFPINKNQISIHLEECGMSKKRTANCIKFECSEQTDDDINIITKEVISKLN